jgi:hypothetical protein
VEHVDVGLEGGVVVVGGGAEGPDGAADDARELGVHGDEGEPVDDVPDPAGGWCMGRPLRNVSIRWKASATNDRSLVRIARHARV